MAREYDSEYGGFYILLLRTDGKIRKLHSCARYEIFRDTLLLREVTAADAVVRLYLRDDEVQWAYRHCSALVAASHDEGFGLPLVEAAHFGLPIICSDIPIFHEVTEDYATFFHEGDAADLARTIRAWMDAALQPEASRLQTLTWR